MTKRTESESKADDAPSVDDVIETFWCDVRQLQILLRAEQSKLVLPRPEYVSQKANHLRDNFVVASKVFAQWHATLAKLHSGPIKFFGVTATSYGAMIHELTFRTLKILESLRLGFTAPQYSISTTSFKPYSFSINDVKKLRRWFDTQEAFHFSGKPDEQVAQIHQRFGELLVGFRQELVHVDLAKPIQQTSEASGQGGKPKGVASSTRAVTAGAKPLRASDAKPNKLCELDEFVLLALGELKAFDKDNRRTAEQVANHLDPKNDRYYVKKPLAKLKRLKLAGSEQGSNGGSWLTPKGRRRFDTLNAKR